LVHVAVRTNDLSDQCDLLALRERELLSVRSLGVERASARLVLVGRVLYLGGSVVAARFLGGRSRRLGSVIAAALLGHPAVLVACEPEGQPSGGHRLRRQLHEILHQHPPVRLQGREEGYARFRGWSNKKVLTAGFLAFGMLAAGCGGKETTDRGGSTDGAPGTKTSATSRAPGKRPAATSSGDSGDGVDSQGTAGKGQGQATSVPGGAAQDGTAGGARPRLPMGPARDAP